MRYLFIILLLSFSFTTTLLVPEEYSTIQSAIDTSSDGDTNNDGIINILDAIIIINLILNNQYENNVDLNNDNIINIQDIIILVNWILE